MKRIDAAEIEWDDLGRVRHDGALFTGEVVRVEADKIIELWTCRNGRQDGPEIEYYPDGSRKSEGRYSAGTLVGDWRTWYSDGKLKEFDVFDRWGSVRKVQRWDEQGNLVEDAEYQGAHGSEW